MAFLSLVTVALSLLFTCPGPAFYALELVVNLVLIAEVTIRFVAFGKHFWKSAFNVVDLLLLIARNVVQCTRLLSVIRRSGYNVASRVTAIDLSDAHDYNLDLDFEEEGSLARQRMRDGGDARTNGMGWAPHTHANEAQPHDTIIAVDDESEL
ncbi:hypothetical protein MOBT1_001476 [Malassezia obtusa]|uniref:Ion transport domain-containing protein n=1 Tax=Malassezia obtusa TaxID=76774 RepID=A0AAF0DZ47_9BASI|nr:hypothetical protein MOBT1_001476 [Malassezia obtusa]